MKLTDKHKEILAHAFSGVWEKERIVLEFSETEEGGLRVMDITKHVDQLEEMVDNE